MKLALAIQESHYPFTIIICKKNLPEIHYINQKVSKEDSMCILAKTSKLGASIMRELESHCRYISAILLMGL